MALILRKLLQRCNTTLRYPDYIAPRLFKRFSGLNKAKITRPVTFPLLGLDMSKYCTDTEAVYDCVATCNRHGGSIQNGHYTAFSVRGDSWYHFDDSKAPSAVEPSGVSSKNENAYVLFYVWR